MTLPPPLPHVPPPRSKISSPGLWRRSVRTAQDYGRNRRAGTALGRLHGGATRAWRLRRPGHALPGASFPCSGTDRSRCFVQRRRSRRLSARVAPQAWFRGSLGLAQLDSRCRKLKRQEREGEAEEKREEERKGGSKRGRDRGQCAGRMRRTNWDRQRWLLDEQSGAPCFARLLKDGRNDLKGGGDWASPRDLNSRDKTRAFQKKKATRQAQTVRVSEGGLGWQDLEAPGAPSSCTSTATLGSQGATPERSRRRCAWSCPATGGRSGARWGSGRRRGGVFSVGLPLRAPTFPTQAIALARG